MRNGVIMEDKIHEVIEDWAGRKTLFENTPSERQRFHRAVHRLSKTEGLKVNREDFESALKKHVDTHSSSSTLHDFITKYSAEAMLILEFLEHMEECI